MSGGSRAPIERICHPRSEMRAAARPHRLRAVVRGLALLSACRGPDTDTTLISLTIDGASVDERRRQLRGYDWSHLTAVDVEDDGTDELLAIRRGALVVLRQGRGAEEMWEGDSSLEVQDVQWVGRGQGAAADLFVWSTSFGRRPSQEEEHEVLVHAVCTPSPMPWCETTGELVLDPGATAFVTGDFDGDGRIDVVTAGDADLVIHRGTGDDPDRPQWDAGRVVGHIDGVGDPWERTLITTDLDGDGRADLVALDETLGLRLLFGTGDGRFAIGPAPSFAMEDGIWRVEVASLDGDAHPDLVARGSNGVVLYEWRGRRVFAASTSFADAKGEIGGDTLVGDFDGDGLDELLLSDSLSTHLIEVGEAPSTWTVTRLDTPEPPYSAVVGDLDGDGRDEAVTLSGPPIYCE